MTNSTYDLYQARQDSLDSYDESEYDQLIKDASDERFNRTISPLYAEASAQVDREAWNELNQLNKDSGNQLELEIEAKKDKLVEQGIDDPNQLLRIISSDPTLSKRYALDRDKINVIHEIQNRIQASRDPRAALAGYEIDSNLGFTDKVLNGFKRTLGDLIYSPQMVYQNHKLANLPLNDLKGIDKKLEAYQKFSNELAEAQEQLFSSDPIEAQDALNKIAYLKGTLEGLQLTPREQEIYNKYGEEYSNIKSELNTLRNDRNTFLGSNKISPEAAQSMMEERARDISNKTLGIKPSVVDDLFFNIKQAAKHPLDELATVASSAMLLMVPGGPWVKALTWGTSMLSEASSIMNDQMEAYIEKHGSLPSEEEWKAFFTGIFATAVDHAGMYGITKGFKASKYLFRGLGKSTKDLAEEAASKMVKETKYLSGFSDAATQSRAAISRAIDIGRKTLTEVDSALQKENTKKAISEIERATRKAEGKTSLTDKVADIMERAAKSTATAPYKLNQALHTYTGTGVQDVINAGLSLTAENVGSTAIQQWGKGEYDQNELAKAAASGLVGGGMFHATSSPAMAGVRYGKNKVTESSIYKKGKEWLFGPRITLDSEKDYNKFLDTVGKLDPEKSMTALQEYSNSLKKIQNGELEKYKNKLTSIAENDSLQKAGLVIDENGVASIDEGKFNASDVASDPKMHSRLEKKAKEYNDLSKAYEKYSKIVEARTIGINQKLNDLIKQESEKIDNKTSTLSEDAQEKVKKAAFKNKSKEDQLKDIQKDFAMSEASAERYYDYINSTKDGESYDFSKDKSSTIQNLDMVDPSLGKSINTLFTEHGVDTAEYLDMLENPDIQEAITKRDYAAFKEALEKDTTLTPARKEKITERFTEDKFNNLKRSYLNEEYLEASEGDFRGLPDNFREEARKTILDESTTFKDDNELINTIQKEDKDSKKFKDAVKRALLQDKVDGIADSEKDTLTKRTNEIINLLPEDQVKDKKDKISEIATETVGAIKEAIKTNNRLYGKKLYTNKEEAEKGLAKLNKYEDIYQVSNVGGKYIIEESDKYKAINEVYDSIFDDDKNQFVEITDDKVDKILDTLDKHGLVDKALLNKSKDAFKEALKRASGKAITEVASTDTTIIKTFLSSYLDKLTKSQAKYQESQKSVEATTVIHGYSTKADFRREALTEKIIEEEKAKEDREKAAESEAKDTIGSFTDKQCMAAVTTALQTIGRSLEVPDKVVLDNPNIAKYAEILKKKAKEGALKQVYSIKDKIEVTNLLNRLYKLGKLGEKTKPYLNACNAILNLFSHIELEENTSTGMLKLYQAGSATEWHKADENINTSFIAAVINKVYPPTNNENFITQTFNPLIVDKGIKNDSEIYRFKSIENRRVRFGNDVINDPAKQTKIGHILKKLHETAIKGTDATGTRGQHSLLDLIFSQIPANELPIKNASSYKDLKDWELVDLFYKVLKTQAFRRAVGFDPNAPKTFTENNFDSNADANIGVTTSYRDSKPGRLVRFRGINKNDTLEERIIKFDKSFESGGVIADAILKGIPSETTANNMSERYIYVSCRYDSSKEAKDVDGVNKLIKAATSVNAAYMAIKKCVKITKQNEKKAVLDHLTRIYLNKNTSEMERTKVYDAMVAVEAYTIGEATTYTEHVPVNYADAGEESLKTFLNTLNNTNSKTKSLEGINKEAKEFNDEQKKADKAAQEVSTLTSSEITAIKDAYSSGRAGFKSVYTYTEDTKLDKELRSRLAKLLGWYINKNEIKNKVTPTAVKKTDTENEIKTESDTSVVEQRLNLSKYGEFLKVNSKNSSVLTKAGSMFDIPNESTNYRGISKLPIILSYVKDLAKAGYSFKDSGECIADSIFGTKYEGNVIYSDEVLNVLAATGLNALQSINMVSSTDWIQSLSKILSPAAANKLATTKGCNLENLVRSLGRQLVHSLGISIEDMDRTPAHLMDTLVEELGLRTINMLEVKGYVEKKYLNTETGELSKEMIEPSMRILSLTPEGEKMLTNINNDNVISQEGKSTVRILDDLLNRDKDKDPIVGKKDFEAKQKEWGSKFNNGSAQRETLVRNFGDGKQYTVTINVDNNFAKIYIKEDDEIYYLPKAFVVKPDGTPNKANAIIEELLNFKTSKKFKRALYDKIIGNKLYKGKDKNKGYVTSWRELDSETQARLGMEEPSDLWGPDSANIESKNEGLLRWAIEFDRFVQGLSGTEDLYFPTIFTLNNRYYVDSGEFNYREFKPYREFFEIADKGHENANNIEFKDDSDSDKKNKLILLKATLLFNLGFPVDKLSFAKIEEVYKNFYEIFKEHRDEIGKGNLDDFSKALAEKEYTAVSKGTKAYKIDKSIPAAILMDALKNNINNTVFDDIAAIENGSKDTIDFPYMIEVDGLNNGTSFHFGQSDLFANTDEISIKKMIAVGVIPTYLLKGKPDAGAEATFGDFITLASNNDAYKDIYILSADKAAANISRQTLVTQVIANVSKNRELESLLRVLGTIYGVGSNNIGDIIKALANRDVIKYIAMPSTYGAGKTALLLHLGNNISKEISKYLAKAGNSGDSSEVINILNQLAELNDGKITLYNKEGKSLEYVKNSTEDHNFEHLRGYAPVIINNSTLFKKLQDACLVEIVNSSNKVTKEAQDRSRIINKGLEAFSNLYVHTINQILSSSEFKDKDLTKLTMQDARKIQKAVNSRLNLGPLDQSLDLMKQCLMPTINDIVSSRLISTHAGNSHLSGRVGHVLNRESSGSKIPPMWVHTLDASTMAMVKARVRDAYGDFLGIHDAEMLNMNQLFGAGPNNNVVSKTNEVYAKTVLFSYKYMKDFENKIRLAYENVRDSMSSDDEQLINGAMNDLEEYSNRQLASTVSILNQAQKADSDKEANMIFNQYSLGGLTGFKLTKTKAAEWSALLDLELNPKDYGDLSEAEQKAWKEDYYNVTEPAAGTKEHTEWENGLKEEYTKWKEDKETKYLSQRNFYNYIKSEHDALAKKIEKNVEGAFANLPEFINYITSKESPVSLSKEEQDKLNNLYKEYIEHVKNTKDVSFYEGFQKAYTTPVEENTAINSVNSSSYKENDTTTQITADTILNSIRLAYTSKGIGLATESNIRETIGGSVYKFSSLKVKSSKRRALAALHLATSNTTASDLNLIDGLLENAYSLTDKTMKEFSAFNDKVPTIVFNGTHVNARELYDHIIERVKNTNLTQVGDAQLDTKKVLTEYINGYLSVLNEEVKDKKATQLVFGMDSIVDYLIVNAILNTNITFQYENLRDISVVVLPKITETGNSVDPDVRWNHFLKDKLGKNTNFKTLGVIARNQNKNLNKFNYLYNNSLSKLGITGKSNINASFAYGSTTGATELCLNMNQQGCPLYAADYYGFLDNNNLIMESGYIKVSPTLIQTDSSPESSGVLAYQNSLSNGPKTIKGVEASFNQKGIYIKGMKVFKNIPLKNMDQDFSAITTNSHLFIPVNSSGSVATANLSKAVTDKSSPLYKAYAIFKKAYDDGKQAYMNNPYVLRENLFNPVTLEVPLSNAMNVTVTFVCVRENSVSASDFLDFVEPVTDSSNRTTGYVLKTYVPDKDLERYANFIGKFKESVFENDTAISYRESPFNQFMKNAYKKAQNTAEDARSRTFIEIPDKYLSSDTVLSDEITAANIDMMGKDTSKNVILMDWNNIPAKPRNNGDSFYYDASITGKEVKNIDFTGIPVGKEYSKSLNELFRANIVNHNKQIIRTLSRGIHGYSYQEQDPSIFEEALYKDLNNEEARELYNKLSSEDGSRNADLDDVFDTLQGMQIKIRHNMVNSDSAKGFAFTRELNSKENVGYITHSYVRGSASNAEVFLHEYSHIPLDFLKHDPNAYRMALQLYEFAAKNLTLEDFDCSNEEAERIYNYIFRNSSTTDPQIEFLVYLLTNKNMINAIDKMSKRVNFKKEFKDKAQSILARFSDSVSGNVSDSKISSDMRKVALTIFKRSVKLVNKLNYKPKVKEEALGSARIMLSKADAYLIKGAKAIADKIRNVSFGKFKQDTLGNNFGRAANKLVNSVGEFAGAVADYSVVSSMKPNTENYTADELVSVLMEMPTEILEGKSELANELMQSFEGVSKGNYSYVKLRYAAKETIDKCREACASALNSEINKMTEDISTKTLNSMTNHVLKSDLSCLVAHNGYNKEEIQRLLVDDTYRYSQMKRYRDKLAKQANGNYFINASIGLANKLVTGVNTSGIGYNNAYEIASMSGSSVSNPNVDSNLVNDIDKFVSLYTMHEIAKKDAKPYKELSKNVDTLMNLFKIHNSLKDMEFSNVYGDSAHKYHMPKGETFGGITKNRYTIVPKSQLEAYEHLGYSKIRKAKLDPIYSRIATEDYYLMEGKFLPNVPYVDGIPVLTDVFNGRNKQHTYLGGTKLLNEHISPEFMNKEFNIMKAYINQRIKDMNSSNFVQMDPKNIDGVFTPTYGFNNKLAGCDFVLNEKDSEEITKHHVKFTSALGDHYGSIIERSKTPEWNKNVAKALDDIYLDRRSSSKFTWLNERMEDNDLVEAYNLLPYEIKEYFNNKYGNQGVPVETKYLSGIVGYREVSANKLDLDYQEKLKGGITNYISYLFHSGPVAKAEYVMRYLTKLGKENIVIKGASVSIDNIISNNVTLGILGLSPKQICNYQLEGLTNLLKYKEMAREKYRIQAQNITNKVMPEADRARIRGIEASMKALPISYIAERGALPTIAEDLSESDRLAKDVIDTYLPKGAQEIAHFMINDAKSPVYQALSDLATFGDVIARYAQFKYLTEDKKINKDEACRQCLQTFIDYSNPLPKFLQYFDSIGALPFTKFLLGNQTNVVNSITRNPSRALSWIAANNYMNMSDIYGSILGFDTFTNRWKLPGFGLFYDSLSKLPSARIAGTVLDIL